MAASNRASRLTKLVADLKKRFKPSLPEDRPLFETLLYASLVENSTHEAAAKALAELEKDYFDWNEVRVSSRAELAERLKPLNDPAESADRLKRTLQSAFETIFGFDMESYKKQNLGQAVKQIAAFDGATPFVVAYVTQRGLSGHAIAVNSGVLLALQVMEIITEAEAKKQVVPGLERAIPKNKGVEAQALLHELGVEVSRSPYSPAVRKLLTELDPTCKDRLPKRPAKKEEPKKEKKPATKPVKEAAQEKAPKKAPEKKAAKKTEATKPAPTKKAAEAKKPAAAKKKAPAPKKAASKPAAAKKAAPKKSATKKKAAPAKKATPKKAATKKATPAKKAKAKKAPAKKTPAKKKPAKKAAKRKPK
ncbi:hypothetical protein MalM25_29180 [Planctomycetes bacterium MalM25]|nr:hypothetical protein MalM25_29180 [Planctomycetes bacterium MalM25]